MKKYLLGLIALSSIELGWTQVSEPINRPVFLQFRFNDYRSDTLTVQVFPQKLGDTRIGAINYRFPVVKGKVRISFPIKNQPCYVHIESRNWPRLWLDNFIVEPGDNVIIDVDSSGKTPVENFEGLGLSCKGQGATKYEARFRVNDAIKQRIKELYAAGPPYFLEHADLETRWSYQDSVLSVYRNALLKALNNFEGKMSSQVYATMKADICYKAARSKTGKSP